MKDTGSLNLWKGSEIQTVPLLLRSGNRFTDFYQNILVFVARLQIVCKAILLDSSFTAHALHDRSHFGHHVKESVVGLDSRLHSGYDGFRNGFDQDRIG